LSLSSAARCSRCRAVAAVWISLIWVSKSPRVEVQRSDHAFSAVARSGIAPGARSRRGATLVTWTAARAGSSVAWRRPA
jgi:hypothetical protein